MDHHQRSAEAHPARRSFSKARIETQIHRRKKAKAVPPLEAEWNVNTQRPLHLRMPKEKMDIGRKQDPPSSQSA
jgi:hypothetical protein